MLKPLLVAYDLYGHHHLLLVIKAFQSLAKTAGPQLVEHFKPIGQMVLHLNLIVAALVIEAKVMAEERRCLDLRSLETQEVDLLIVLDLELLVVGEALVAEERKGLPTGHRELNLVDADRRVGLLRI